MSCFSVQLSTDFRNRTGLCTPPGKSEPPTPLSVESLTPRTSTYSTLRYELWKLSDRDSHLEGRNRSDPQRTLIRKKERKKERNTLLIS